MSQALTTEEFVKDAREARDRGTRPEGIPKSNKGQARAGAVPSKIEVNSSRPDSYMVRNTNATKAKDPLSPNPSALVETKLSKRIARITSVLEEKVDE